MLEQELLVRTVQVMDEYNIKYMLTGSYASSLQGLPRSTDCMNQSFKEKCLYMRAYISSKLSAKSKKRDN